MSAYLPSQELYLWILFLVFLAASVIQLVYFWGIFSRLAFFKKKEKAYEKQPVSVVICARNEYYNLKKNLPMILEQDHPEFEVVVVNDSSDDDTSFLLKSLSEQYSHLKIVEIHHNMNFFSGKKFPLAIGIKSAKHNVLLLTDADCRPTSPLWLRIMQSNFTRDTDIVLGYGGYADGPGLLNKLIRFETVFIAMQYLSCALSGFPYMGVGRNLSYKKSLFYESKGFIPHYRIRSGDDDLFINQVAHKKNTRIEVSHEAHTVSEPKKTFNTWIRQKKRHLTTGKHYKLRDKIMLGTFISSQFFFFATFIALLVTMNSLMIIIPVFCVRLISTLLIFKLSMNKLSEKNLLLYLPLFEIFFMIFNPIVSLSAAFTRNDKWK